MLSPAAILAARRRIAAIVTPTPLERSLPLSELWGAEVFLKLECAQITGSFKLRGAANNLLADVERRPVLTCSAGNHALGVAHAAAALGTAATLVVPKSASPAKLAALRRYPVSLELYGESYDEAEAEALRRASAEGLRFVSPYNDPLVIAGQGTVAAEIYEQLPLGTASPLIVVGCGGGGLLAGIALWAKAVDPDARIIGVQPANSAAMVAALRAGRVVAAPDLPTLADGLAGGIEPNAITFPLIQRLVDDMVLVSEEQIADAIAWLLDEHHLVVEGSGAVTVAALLNGLLPRGPQPVVAVLSGRNIASATLLKASQMRHEAQLQK